MDKVKKIIENQTQEVNFNLKQARGREMREMGKKKIIKERR